MHEFELFVVVGITKLGIVSSCSRYGRRNIILINLAIQAVFGVGAAFAPNFYVYIALRFVVGTTVSGVIMNAFVLGECAVQMSWFISI